jgi:hypothetical protein
VIDATPGAGAGSASCGLPAVRPGRPALVVVPEWTESGEDKFIPMKNQPLCGEQNNRLAELI